MFRCNTNVYIYINIYTSSMSRIISITEDVYETLTRLKGKDSFSRIIRELISKTSNKEKILSFFGKGGIDEEKIKELKPLWKKWSEKYV